MSHACLLRECVCVCFNPPITGVHFQCDDNNHNNNNNSRAGKQTLGQEYCGVDLTAPGGGGSRGTSALSKTPLRAYTFLRVAVPYLQVDGYTVRMGPRVVTIHLPQRSFVPELAARNGFHVGVVRTPQRAPTHGAGRAWPPGMRKLRALCPHSWRASPPPPLNAPPTFFCYKYTEVENCIIS